MQEPRTASSVQSIELVSIFMMFSTTLFAMEKELFPPFNEPESETMILYEKQRASCATSIINSIEQYILVLPTELGCSPCQYLHYYMNSFKAQHVEKRKEQLMELKNHIKENGLCEVDVKTYVLTVMGSFSGDYGKKFKEICITMVDNLSLFLKIIAKDPVQQCLMCKQAAADKEYGCGHKTICVSCDNKRLYHLCPICLTPAEVGEMTIAKFVMAAHGMPYFFPVVMLNFVSLVARK